MRNLFFSIAVLGLMLVGAAAQGVSRTNSVSSVTLAWNPASGAAGYNLYFGTASGVYTNVINAGLATNVTVTPLVRGTTYFFAATTYAGGLESVYSAEINYTVAGLPAAPTNMVLRVNAP